MTKKNATSQARRRRRQHRAKSFNKYRVIIELLAVITLALHLIEKALH
jgi:hypothetical protein